MADYWTDKVVIVTGASSGVGRSCVEEMSAHGAKVVLAARRLERMQEICENLPRSSTLIVQTDVGKKDQVDEMVRQTLERFGRIDVLVNNAAVGMGGNVITCPLDKYEELMQINVFGALYCMRAVYPHMQAQGGGTIINVSSIAGFKGFYTCGLYASSKHALNGMSESLGETARRDNIHVGLICPGKIETEFDQKLLYYEGKRSTENSGIEAREVCRAIMRAAEKKKRLIVLGKRCMPLYLLNRLSPGLTNFLIRKLYA